MKRKLAFIGAIAAALSAGADAANPGLGTDSGYEIGILASSYRYDEVVDDAAFISIKGGKAGVMGSLTNTYDLDGRNWFARLDGRYAAGSVSYEGSGTSSGNDTLLDVRVTGGLDVPANGYTMAYYGGVGVRMLYNDLRGVTSTGAVGYRRESTYYYLPLGMTHRFAWNDRARVSTTLEWDYLVAGRQLSRTSDFGADNDLLNSQCHGYGIRVGSDYETQKWSAGVFYHLWRIADSEPAIFTYAGSAYMGMEPKNMTQEFGVQMKYRFH